jgi:hypothetical protein
LTPAAATLSNPAAAGVKFLRRNCKTLPPPGVKCGRHIQLRLTISIFLSISNICIVKKEVLRRKSK